MGKENRNGRGWGGVLIYIIIFTGTLKGARNGRNIIDHGKYLFQMFFLEGVAPEYGTEEPVGHIV